MVTIHEAGFQTVAIFMQNGELEKKEPAANAVSDNVEDSSNKIFIGGFSKAISSEMVC
jgi:splicing factor U2AF subunit